MNVRLRFWLLVVGAALGAVASRPGTASGLQIETLYAERQLEYQSARQAFESARTAQAAIESRFQRATQAADRARATSDQDALEIALGQSLQISQELTAQDRRVEQTRDGLEKARTSFLDVIDARLELLAGRIEYASIEERAALGAVYRDLSAQYDEVLSERGERTEFLLVLMPEMTRDPRDGPSEFRAKAQILERRAAQYDSLIVVVGGEIEDTRKRVQQDRQIRQFVSGLGRFEDNQPPGSTAAPEASASGGPVSVAPRDLEADLLNLEVLLGRYEDYRDEARRRATEFNRLAREVT